MTARLNSIFMWEQHKNPSRRQAASSKIGAGGEERGGMQQKTR